MNMKNMIEEQKNQGERLLVLKTKPARRGTRWSLH